MEIFIQKGVFPEAELLNHHRYSRDQLANFYNKHINEFANFEQPETYGSLDDIIEDYKQSEQEKKKASQEIKKKLNELQDENFKHYEKHGKPLPNFEDRKYELYNKLQNIEKL